MNTRKRAIAFVICLFLLLALGIVYIFSELYTESEIPEVVVTDGMLFKEEYEAINNNENEDGSIVRELDIPEDNPFIYKDATELVESIDNDETFVVYFGYASCPWCRSIITPLIEAAQENDIDTIYYVDVQNIRDRYELNDDNEAVRTVEGSEAYYELLDRLDSVLEPYSPLVYTTKSGKLKNVEIDEKRIYAPSVVVVKNGEAMELKTGINELQTDAYMQLTDEMIEESKGEFTELFELLNGESQDYICEDQKC